MIHANIFARKPKDLQIADTTGTGSIGEIAGCGGRSLGIQRNVIAKIGANRSGRTAIKQVQFRNGGIGGKNFRPHSQIFHLVTVYKVYVFGAVLPSGGRIGIEIDKLQIVFAVALRYIAV